MWIKKKEYETLKERATISEKEKEEAKKYEQIIRAVNNDILIRVGDYSVVVLRYDRLAAMLKGKSDLEQKVRELEADNAYFKVKYYEAKNNISEVKESSNATHNDTEEMGEWIIAIDNFEDGQGNRELPHCSKCNRGVYFHDAGSFCPFCGKAMKNPKR